MQTNRFYEEEWSRQLNKTTIQVMPKDPGSLFVYWQVEDDRKAMVSSHLNTQWSNLPFYLCVYDVTGVTFNGENAPCVRTIRLHTNVDEWYINELLPGHRYVIDFATTTIQRQRFTILRSDVVELPPAKVVPGRPSVRWIQVFPPQKHETKINFNEQSESKSVEASRTTPDRYPYESTFDGYHSTEGKVSQG